ncbi:protein of unknown function [Paraburkholderia kururiensis]
MYLRAAAVPGHCYTFRLASNFCGRAAPAPG